MTRTKRSSRAHGAGAVIVATAPCGVESEGAGPPARRPEPRSFFDIFHMVELQLLSLLGRRTPNFEDLLQSASEQVWRALPTFEGRARLSTFTFRICYLTVLKNARSERVWSRRVCAVDQEDLARIPADRVNTDRSPESIMRLERLKRLRSSLPALSDKLRAVVLMHDIEGLPIDEIAGIVGANTMTVRSRLRDGRRALVKLLANDPYFRDVDS